MGIANYYTGHIPHYGGIRGATSGTLLASWSGVNGPIAR